MAYETMVSLNPDQAMSLAEQMNFAPRMEHDTYFAVSLFRDGVNCVSYPDYMEAEKGLPSPAGLLSVVSSFVCQGRTKTHTWRKHSTSKGKPV
jgi:hypothetical protein